MHPSSFYDLWACYVYTPLHGPYSLSEALKGLISYPLDESQDFITISSKRTLRHELISELSNVMDDLQDYLVYFSSRFLISSLNSPDLIKDLWASCNGPKYLTVCWGAIIMHLVTACRIVKCNFWPNFFQPSLNKLTSLQKLKQQPPFVLPNVLWNKLLASASTFLPSFHIDCIPHSPYCLLDSQCRLFNLQSPQMMPSKSNPTGGKESHASSSRLDTTPMPPGLHPI